METARRRRGRRRQVLVRRLVAAVWPASRLSGVDDDDTRLCSIKSPANGGITARLRRNPCVSLTNSCLLGCREGYETVEVAFDRCIVAFGVSKMTGL